MFRFSRYEKQACVGITVDVPNYDKREFLFYWDAVSKEFAGLLVDLFQTRFMKYRKEILTEGYMAGWNDAKAKRAKGASKYWE